MQILGIETSCDETAAAVVSRKADGSPVILSNKVLSQIDEHSEFGGVVPELAARAHLRTIDHLIKAALQDANCGLEDIDGIAVTAGPGLIGGLMVGLMTAKAMAASRNIPYLAINHLEGHALTARLTNNLSFPYMLLLVSGGHSQILRVDALGSYKRLATTIDDALGETFDKTAKLLDLGFPGGPNVEKTAKHGDPFRFKFPKPLHGQDTLNMSFSGLKTAIRTEAQKIQPLSKQDTADLCASMQKTIAEILADRCARALEKHGSNISQLVIAGGVAANSEIRKRLQATAQDHNIELIAPPAELCTDNAAMIAWAGLERFEKGERSDFSLSPRSRWPLDENSDSVIGKGRKGAKV
ncbi:MAG: tRNA (adenosine(37)-N6)-threonylcarbamoyltransferase complex transferase subunit TsaD [Pseudomonadota bacterium]